jgi:aldose 1-epimerase
VWGHTASGAPVERYTLSSSEISVDVITFGARVVSLQAADRAGVKADVVLGYASLNEYEADTTYQGAIVGRYGNRIAHGTFEIDGHVFHVPTNNNGNALHGGPEGFDKKVWVAHEIPGGVEMTLVSGDGDMGFPGELSVQVRYTIEKNSLHIIYAATTTKPTVVNLTNHCYFNLCGEGQGTILDHTLMLSAAAMTPVHAGLIPTGALASVEGTPFDFRKLTKIGERIDVDNEQLKCAGGYDHNWVLNGDSGSLRLAAEVFDLSSGRTLTVKTTEPGVQFYSGNFLKGMFTGKSGAKYERHFGFCLETQHFPDSPNHPEFPSTLLSPGETLHSETIFSFGVET